MRDDPCRKPRDSPDKTQFLHYSYPIELYFLTAKVGINSFAVLCPSLVLPFLGLPTALDCFTSSLLGPLNM